MQQNLYRVTIMSNTLGSPLPKYASVEFPSAATGYKDKETEGYYIEDG